MYRVLQACRLRATLTGIGFSLGIRLPLPNLLSERVQERLVPASATPMHNRRRRIMKMLIPALAFAIVIVAPSLTEPTDARAAARKPEPAGGKLGRDGFLSGQNEKCYWPRGRPNHLH